MNMNGLPSAAFYVSLSDYAIVLSVSRKGIQGLEKRDRKASSWLWVMLTPQKQLRTTLVALSQRGWCAPRH